jgi:methylthioribose-1-phosphate isomerase
MVLNEPFPKNRTFTMPAPEPIRFDDHCLVLIDQTKLPIELTEFVCRNVDQVHDAIRRLVVRGAPAIGIAAAYGVCLAGEGSQATPEAYLKAIDHLATSRPTAVNLFWALDRMREVVEMQPADRLHEALLEEAKKIHDEDREMCFAIGRHGAGLLDGLDTVLTHCNAGGLATSIWGTALAPIYHLHQSGRAPKVLADETRPLLQGGRLTAWELSQAGVDVTVITDSMAGSLMKRGMIDAVIVGADRITARGDVANKIGTYSVAVLARHHNLPFYVAAPVSTFDWELESGDDIPIEQRGREEVAAPHGVKIVPDAAGVLNPAFDVTPAELVTAIITERGVVETPTKERLAAHFAATSS